MVDSLLIFLKSGIIFLVTVAQIILPKVVIFMMILVISKESGLLSSVYLMLIIFLALNPHRVFLFFVLISILVSTEIMFKLAIQIDYPREEHLDLTNSLAIKYVILTRFFIII